MSQFSGNFLGKTPTVWRESEQAIIAATSSGSAASDSADSASLQYQAVPPSDKQHDVGTGLAIAEIIRFNGDLPILLIADDSEQRIVLASVVACHLNCQHDVGTAVCVAFINQDTNRPIVVGKITHGLRQRSASSSLTTVLDNPAGIEMRCGKACILLKPDGTVAIRGTNVASRATHTNRIRGGNVQIN